MKIHLIGIGENPMQNLADALQKNGHGITGSDDAIKEFSNGRAGHDLLPQKSGWFPENISHDLDAVVFGKHINANNPEVRKAKELGLKIYSYPAFLFDIAKDKTRIVIAGSQGRTSITSMILHVMEYHGKEVDFFVGTAQEGRDSLVHLTGENDFIVIEGNEDPASVIDEYPEFHYYQPNIALLSGIARDQISVSIEEHVEHFEKFVDSIVNGGILVYNEEDSEVKRIAEETTNPVRKHPYSTPQYHVQDSVNVLDTPEGEMPLEIFGEQQISNLAGAKWICQHMGIDEDDFYEAIATFKEA